MNQKGLAPILIVILFAAALVGGYFIFTNFRQKIVDVYYSNNRTKTSPSPTTQPKSSPSPSNVTYESTTSGETANWKTYTNKTFGYSIKLPDTYEALPQTDRQKSQLGIDQNTCITKKGDQSCKLIINVFTLSQYKLIDNAGGFIFYFDVNKKQWLHDKINDTSQFVPKSIASPIEAYAYKTGYVKCSQEYTLIPTPSYDNMIEIINTKCRDDEGNPLPGYDDFPTDQILSTFKFLP